MQHRGIEYSVTTRGGVQQWTWRFLPPIGNEKVGHVRGQRAWADTIAKRGIDIWLLMNAADIGARAAALPQSRFIEAAE